MIRRILILAALCVASMGAWAQSLTPAQQTTVRAFACADTGTARPYVLNGDANSLRAWLNTQGTFVVWRTSVPLVEILRNPAYDWTRVDNLSVGKARIWEMMFMPGPIDCSRANIRAGIDAVWVGTAADLAVRAVVMAQCKRNSNRVEQALATGTGTTATPGLLTYEGEIGETDSVRLLYNDNGTLKGC